MWKATGHWASENTTYHNCCKNDYKCVCTASYMHSQKWKHKELKKKTVTVFDQLHYVHVANFHFTDTAKEKKFMVFTIHNHALYKFTFTYLLTYPCKQMSIITKFNRYKHKRVSSRNHRVYNNRHIMTDWPAGDWHNAHTSMRLTLHFTVLFHAGTSNLQRFFMGDLLGPALLGKISRKKNRNKNQKQ